MKFTRKPTQITPDLTGSMTIPGDYVMTIGKQSMTVFEYWKATKKNPDEPIHFLLTIQIDGKGPGK